MHADLPTTYRQFNLFHITCRVSGMLSCSATMAPPAGERHSKLLPWAFMVPTTTQSPTCFGNGQYRPNVVLLQLTQSVLSPRRFSAYWRTYSRAEIRLPDDRLGLRLRRVPRHRHLSDSVDLPFSEETNRKVQKDLLRPRIRLSGEPKWAEKRFFVGYTVEQLTTYVERRTAKLSNSAASGTLLKLYTASFFRDG